MAASVAAITSASDAAEALLNRTSDHISDTIANVDTSNEDEVDECFNQLQAFADQLNDEAGQLAAAVVAGTPADPAANNGGGASAEAGTVDPHTIEGAAAAGGYNTTDGSAPPPPVDQTLPPAAGQHEDAPVEQPRNSTLDELEPPTDDNATGTEQPSGEAGTTSGEQPAGDQTSGDGGEGQAADSADSADAGAGSGSDATAGDDAA